MFSVSFVRNPFFAQSLNALNFTYQLLRILESNFKKMQTFLSYGDGESATALSFRNERIIELLERSKQKSANSKLALIQSLVDSCLVLQEDCDQKLTEITSEYKKEFHISSIKIQLKKHLNNT